MAHALVDRYEDPERVIEILVRRRRFKTVAVVGGLAVGLAVMIAASAAMYADEPDGKRPPAASHF